MGETLMFDFVPDEEPWQDEPTEDEVLRIILQVKRQLIQTYRLQATANLELRVPNRFQDCNNNDLLFQHIAYLAARKCLEVSVFTAKTLLPQKYFYLFDNLLTNWMPNIN